MRPEIEPYAKSPEKLPVELVRALIHGNIRRKSKIKIWTTERVLREFAVPRPGFEYSQIYSRFSHRVNEILRELAASGDLVQRPLKQSSRTMGSVAYERAGVESHPADENEPGNAGTVTHEL